MNRFILDSLKAGMKIQCIKAEKYWCERKILTVGKIYTLEKLNGTLLIRDDEGIFRNSALWNNNVQAIFNIVQSCDSEEIE